jgi:hypothetical protein
MTLVSFGDASSCNCNQRTLHMHAPWREAAYARHGIDSREGGKPGKQRRLLLDADDVAWKARGSRCGMSRAKPQVRGERLHGPSERFPRTAARSIGCSCVEAPRKAVLPLPGHPALVASCVFDHRDSAMHGQCCCMRTGAVCSHKALETIETELIISKRWLVFLGPQILGV